MTGVPLSDVCAGTLRRAAAAISAAPIAIRAILLVAYPQLLPRVQRALPLG